MQVSAQFADSLYALERLQALRLALWGGTSLLIGTAQIAALRLTRRDSGILRHFGIQCLLWGVLWIGTAIWWRSALQLRDLAGAVALDRTSWFAVGAATALAIGSVALILHARGASARAPLLGAGIGTLTQALATVVLALQLSAAIVR